MDRLSRYLCRQFLAQALTIFLAGGALIWLMQLLRLFDLISAQGQTLLTLMGQSILTTPTYARSILYVCFAIGLVRALRALAASRELHTIHAAQRTGALWRATAAFTFIGMATVTLVANWIEPESRRLYAEWSAEIAADVVGRALLPGQFSEIEPGIVLTIGDRMPDGTLVDFFLDDSTNPETRRTYVARTARIMEDEAGYQLILDDGAIQYEGAGHAGLSQIAFVQYHISLASLIEAVRPEGDFEQMTSPRLLAAALDPDLPDAFWAGMLLHHRLADTLRALSLCALVAALCAFPDGSRRQSRVPLELVVLMIAFAEQAVSAFSGGGAAHYIAPSAILFLALLLFWRRLARADLVPRLLRIAR